jgi:hypothetical protein
MAIRARVNAQATSMTTDGDTGTATGGSPLGQISSSFSYDEAAQTLTVTCLKKPFLVSDGLFQSKMQDLVDSVSG